MQQKYKYKIFIIQLIIKSEEYLKQINREIAIGSELKNIRSDNLIRIYEIDVRYLEGQIFIIMEYCDGGDLKQKIDKKIK